MIGSQRPWTARNGLPERSGYIYRGKHRLSDEQRAQVEQRLAQLAAAPRSSRSCAHSIKQGWSTTNG